MTGPARHSPITVALVDDYDVVLLGVAPGDSAGSAVVVSHLRSNTSASRRTNPMVDGERR